MIPALFPPEVAAPLLHRLENAGTGPTRKIWQDTRQESQRGSTFSPDGRLVVTTGENVVRVWDAETGREVRSLSVPGVVKQVAFRTDGKTIAVTTFGGCVQTFDLATGRDIEGSCGQ